ncbi:hypothetical protein GCM10010151_40710 [Actinoallomurus spadix]|uniref:Histidine kinase/HSP90-like ATPase domain-containing protein n=2 Tax=Actinoallomurus spadix TaxID=79912 RepID=A0ABN0WUD7_9ACTN
MEVAGSPSVVPGVRHWVRKVLGDLSGDICDRMEIIASEYATNCVRHSTAAEGGNIHLRLTAEGERIRLEVRDEGPRREAPDLWAADEAADFGRGLHIVAQLADDMGDEASSEGRLAWAEVKAWPTESRSTPGCMSPSALPWVMLERAGEAVHIRAASDVTLATVHQEQN